MVTAGIFPFKENSHSRDGNQTRDLMISNQRLWPLGHEAGSSPFSLCTRKGTPISFNREQWEVPVGLKVVWVGGQGGIFSVPWMDFSLSGAQLAASCFTDWATTERNFCNNHSGKELLQYIYMGGTLRAISRQIELATKFGKWEVLGEAYKEEVLLRVRKSGTVFHMFLIYKQTHRGREEILNRYWLHIKGEMTSRETISCKQIKDFKST